MVNSRFALPHPLSCPHFALSLISKIQSLVSLNKIKLRKHRGSNQRLFYLLPASSQSKQQEPSALQYYRCSKMAHVLAMVVDGVGGFVKTLWALQERRWSYTFDAVASAAVSVTMALVLCLLSIRTSYRHRRGDMLFASF